MKKITDFRTINRAEFDALRAEINTALKAIADKYGIALQAQKIKVSDKFATIELMASAIESDGTVITREAKSFQEYCHLFGLHKDDLGKEIVMGGVTYKITGLHPNSPKYPVQAQRTDSGQMYKFQAEGVVRKLHGTGKLTEVKKSN